MKKYNIDEGYYPLEEAMAACGYTYEGYDSYHCEIGGKQINITFDFDGNSCQKNQYAFSLEDSFKEEGREFYVRKNVLESILNVTLEYSGGKVTAKDCEHTAHEWCEQNALIAHAGGAIREKGTIAYYSNAFEALVQNYELGHRVFEIDMYLTSDNNIAAVHDWDKFGNKDGTAMSADEWENGKTWGSPETGTLYTPMLIGDVLDEMLVNRDMYIVTDSKYTDERAKIQFQLIYDEAVKRDPELLDRIIPQIYNEQMYGIIEDIYHFPSVIYTTYATGDTAERIINFADSKSNIKVITAYTADERFNEQTIKLLHDKGLLLYTHTINTYTQFTRFDANGYDGIYTDIMTPSDIKEHNSAIK